MSFEMPQQTQLVFVTDGSPDQAAALWLQFRVLFSTGIGFPRIRVVGSFDSNESYPVLAIKRKFLRGLVSKFRDLATYSELPIGRVVMEDGARPFIKRCMIVLLRTVPRDDLAFIEDLPDWSAKEIDIFALVDPRGPEKPNSLFECASGEWFSRIIDKVGSFHLVRGPAALQGPNDQCYPPHLSWPSSDCGTSRDVLQHAADLYEHLCTPELVFHPGAEIAHELVGLRGRDLAGRICDGPYLENVRISQEQLVVSIHANPRRPWIPLNAQLLAVVVLDSYAGFYSARLCTPITITEHFGVFNDDARLIIRGPLLGYSHFEHGFAYESGDYSRCFLRRLADADVNSYDWTFEYQ